jgi:hypothetical protein
MIVTPQIWRSAVLDRLRADDTGWLVRRQRCRRCHAWLVAAVALVQLPFNAKPNSITGWLRFNPLNVMLYTDKLTARGVTIRRRLFLAVAVFVASILVGWAMFGIIKLVALGL